MKKVYIAPCVEVIKVSAVGMIATSGPGFDTSATVYSGEELGREDNAPSAPGVWDSEW